MALSSPWLTSHTLEDFLVMDRRRTRPGSSSLGEGLGLCKSPGCNLRSFSYGEKSTHCPEGPSPFPAPYTPDLRRKTPPCLLFQASISSIPGVSSLACPRANGVRASAVKGKGLSADSRHGSGRWKCESGAGCGGIRGRDTFRSHCGGDGSGRKRRTAAWETEGEWPERSRGEQAPAPEERASGRRPGQSWHSVQPQGPGSPPDGPWLDVACFHHWFFFFQKKQISSGRFQIKMQPCFQTSL